MKILLIFTFCLISDGGVSKEVTGYSGGGVLIKCKYHKEYTQNQKYFCKGESTWTSCSDQIKTGDKDQWVNSGRFSMFDDTKSAEFRVMIRELTVWDTGKYQCGIDQFGLDIYTPVELKVKEGGLVSGEVTAYAGGRINIKCRYEDEYKNKPKSFCKIGTHQWCFNQIQTKLPSEWVHDGRFSIHDNRSAGYFSVFIRELMTEDTGTYMCAVIVSNEIEICTVVELNVRDDLYHEKSISKTVHIGGDLNFSCKYPESLRSDLKFLCKRLHTAFCFYKQSVKESRKVVNGEKFSLYDDRAKQIFTVTMRNVTEQDSGEYWCGGERAWESDHGYKTYFTQINLTVTDSILHSTVSSSTSSSLSSSGPTPTYVPRGLSPVSIVVTVLVNLLIALLIGSICLLVILQIKRKIKGSAASSNRQSVPVLENSCEEYKDTRNLFASEAETSAGPSTAQLPTSPSIYINTMLPTNPCDSLSIASVAQLPTSFTDSSISPEKSAEGLTYATVRFHNAPSSDDSDPKIRFKKEEDLCEYATVSHGNSYG